MLGLEIVFKHFILFCPCIEVEACVEEGGSLLFLLTFLIIYMLLVAVLMQLIQSLLVRLVRVVAGVNSLQFHWSAVVADATRTIASLL